MIYLIAAVILLVMFIWLRVHSAYFETRYDGYYLIYYKKVIIDTQTYEIPKYIRIWKTQDTKKD